MLRGINHLAETSADLNELQCALKEARAWKPAAGLLAEVAWAQDKVAQLGASWGHKLIVALVGPSGAGKSTLLNALAGKELSASGIERPTTRQIVVYVRAIEDADDLVQHCGSAQVQVVTDYEAAGLEHLVLVDSPDTNTIPENQALLRCVLERADLLITMFPALNPKLGDNVSFLRPYVAMLPSDAIIPVLNWVDRVPRGELEEVIVPDFKRWIAQEWGLQTPPFLVSAKSSVPGVRFMHDEQPLHNINQIDELRSFIFGSLDRAEQLSDRRLERANHILQLVRSDIHRALAEQAPQRAAARQLLNEIGSEATRSLTQAPLSASLTAQMNSNLYTDLGQCWWGPVGWLIVVWSLILKLAGAVSQLFRRNRLTLPLRATQTEQDSLIAASRELAGWASRIEQLHADRWPPAISALRAAGFNNELLKPDVWDTWVSRRSQQLTEQWGMAYRECIERAAEQLSFWLVQLVFNLPVVAVLGWLAYQTVNGFIQQQYFTLDYFRHSGITALLVWLGSFILLQIVVTIVVRGAMKKALMWVIRKESRSEAPLLEQFRALDTLEALC